MKLKTLLLTLLLSTGLSGTAYADKFADKFHCRITEVRDYDTKQVVNSSPKMEEFVIKIDTIDTLRSWGDLEYGLSRFESPRAYDRERRRVSIGISHLDNKFFGLYLEKKLKVLKKPQGWLVSGFCTEISKISGYRLKEL